MKSVVYFLFRRRTLFLTVAPILMLLVAKPTPRLFWTGLPLVLVGETVRIWSAGYLMKLDRLATGGPFALCRNPLYVGSFLIAAGFLTMSGRLDVWIIGTVLFWLFHGGAIVYEEGLLRERHGTEFDEYCRQTPRLLPRLRRTAGDGSFSVRQAAVNREFRSALGTAAIAALFGIAAYLPVLVPARLLFN